MNAAAVIVKMERRALTLSTRTRVAVSPVTRERTARQVNVDKDGPGTHDGFDFMTRWLFCFSFIMLSENNVCNIVSNYSC